ncbi:MAG: DUF2752 domain-containing protein [Paludibacteraceae bacterium]|nr:DUF2752 domain-containing protein [Paludibacteraceae bacterium]
MGSFKSKRAFLLFSVALLLVAYVWLAINMWMGEGNGFIVCPFRRITSLPCPGCGLTTSILLMLKGEFATAVGLNPMVLLALPMLVVSPILLALKADRCYELWCGFEEYVRNGKWGWILFLIIAIDWIYLIISSLYGRI